MNCLAYHLNVSLLLTAFASAPPLESLDAFGDQLPYGVQARLGTVRYRSDFPINCIAVSPKGDAIACGGDNTDKTKNSPILIWQIPQGKLIGRLLGHKQPIHSLTYSPDGALLVSGASDGTVRLWNVKTLKEVAVLVPSRDEAVESVAFSPDGKRLAASADGKVVIWDVEQKTRFNEFKVTPLAIHSLVFAPSGKILATAGMDKRISLWDTNSFKLLRRLDGYTSHINSLAFVPDGTRLLSGGDDKEVRAWNLLEDQAKRVLSHHNSSVTSIAISPNGRLVAACDTSGAILLSDIDTNRGLFSLTGAHDVINAVAFSQDGSTLFSGGVSGCIRLWHVQTGKEIEVQWGHKARVVHIAFTRQGKELISCSQDGTVKVWSIQASRPLISLTAHRDYVTGLAVSPKAGTICSVSLDHSIRLWDIDKTAEVAKVTLPKALKGVVWLGDGLIATRSIDAVQIVDVLAGRVLRQIDARGSNYYGNMSWSLRKKMIAFDDDNDRSIKLWKTTEWIEWMKLPYGLDEVTGIGFSPDGELLASGSSFNSVLIWDLKDKGARKRLTGAGPATDFMPMLSVGFSPDGRMVAGGTADGNIIVWETATSRQICQFSGHSDRVNCVQFSSEFGILGSASSDHTILIWDMRQLLEKEMRQSSLALSMTDLWTKLADFDAKIGYCAILAAVVRGNDAVRHISKEVIPVFRPKSNELKTLLDDLASDRFKLRDASMRELSRLVDICDQELLETRAKTDSLEVIRRIDEIRKSKSKLDGQRLRIVRAVAILEIINSVESVALLSQFSRGAEEALLTKEARAALQRIYDLRGK